jgi:hypothetical protein
VAGPKLNGKILPGGADWQIVRADGVVHLQALHRRNRDRRPDPDRRRGLPSRPGRGDGTARQRRDR